MREGFRLYCLLVVRVEVSSSGFQLLTVGEGLGSCECWLGGSMGEAVRCWWLWGSVADAGIVTSVDGFDGWVLCLMVGVLAVVRGG